MQEVYRIHLNRREAIEYPTDTYLLNQIESFFIQIHLRKDTKKVVAAFPTYIYWEKVMV